MLIGGAFKCIILFLITIIWAQTDFDKLILKNDTKYLENIQELKRR